MKSTMNNVDLVQKQYTNDTFLNIRKNLHQKYSFNKLGFGNFLYDLYPLKKNIKILELGSGNGDMWITHIDDLKDIDLTLSDFSEGMVSILKDTYKETSIQIKQINIESIPYDDDSFDIVIANMMLYHVPNINKALTEVKRVLKENGLFYCATFGENGLTEHIKDTLNHLKIIEKETIDYPFTLQNGTNKLSKHFKQVTIKQYIDYLEVTNAVDLLSYIKTMQTVKELDHNEEQLLLDYYNKIIDSKGSIHIPKEYGSFVCKKWKL